MACCLVDWFLVKDFVNRPLRSRRQVRQGKKIKLCGVDQVKITLEHNFSQAIPQSMNLPILSG